MRHAGLDAPLSAGWSGSAAGATKRSPGTSSRAKCTVVTDPRGAALIDIEPIGFDEAMRWALVDDPGLRRG